MQPVNHASRRCPAWSWGPTPRSVSMDRDRPASDSETTTPVRPGSTGPAAERDDPRGYVGRLPPGARRGGGGGVSLRLDRPGQGHDHVEVGVPQYTDHQLKSAGRASSRLPFVMVGANDHILWHGWRTMAWGPASEAPRSAAMSAR